MLTFKLLAIHKWLAKRKTLKQTIMLKYTLLILQLLASLWLGILFLFFPEKVSDLIIMLFSLTFFFRIPSIILSIRIHSLDRLIASIKKEIDEKSKILEDLKSKTNEKRTE